MTDRRPHPMLMTHILTPSSTARWEAQSRLFREPVAGAELAPASVARDAQYGGGIDDFDRAMRERGFA